MQRFAIIRNIDLLTQQLARLKDKKSREYCHSLLRESRRQLAWTDIEQQGASDRPAGLFRSDARILDSHIRLPSGDCKPSLFPSMIIDPGPGLCIVDVNFACTRELMRPGWELIGSKLFKICPDNAATLAAEGVANAFAAMADVMTIGKPQILPSQRYDISDPKGSWHERHWRVECKPLRDSDGTIAFISLEFERTEPEVEGGTPVQRYNHRAA